MILAVLYLLVVQRVRLRNITVNTFSAKSLFIFMLSLSIKLNPAHPRSEAHVFSRFASRKRYRWCEERAEMTTIHGTGTPIKSEFGTQHANGEESKVKLEPDVLGASPGVQSDEDLYEDAGDLDFSNAIQGIYLTRIPRFLWENWSKLDDDQEIQLGTVRVEGTGGDVRRVRRYLNLLHGKSI